MKATQNQRAAKTGYLRPNFAGSDDALGSQLGGKDPAVDGFKH
jgi:hypothetical protein